MGGVLLVALLAGAAPCGGSVIDEFVRDHPGQVVEIEGTLVSIRVGGDGVTSYVVREGAWLDHVLVESFPVEGTEDLAIGNAVQVLGNPGRSGTIDWDDWVRLVFTGGLECQESPETEVMGTQVMELGPQPSLEPDRPAVRRPPIFDPLRKLTGQTVVL
ncbi:MAG: hypothetical protein KatS3mg011_1454 [Acidimicrobiia bacterium]|nr:MAG: hypothetical protein KatS3mg011_1454 [Acidimicrobiia bacterium]